jgi:YidC/Oxa1 family membrane protein insertase
MDRTSRIGLAVCLIGLIVFQFTMDKFFPPPPPKPHVPAAATASTPATTGPPTANISSGPAVPGETPKPAASSVPEKLTVIENDAMKVTFTSLSAAITEIELKGQKADNGGNVILNEHAHSNVLALTGWPGVDAANFQVQENGGTGVTYTADLPNGVTWQRTYAFGQDKEYDGGLGGYLREFLDWISVELGHAKKKPLIYTLDVSDTLKNSGAADVTLPSYALSIGRAVPLRVGGHYQRISNTYLGSGWYASRFHQTTISNFEPSYFLFFKQDDGKDLISSTSIDPSPLRWIGVENQFFTVLLTPVADKAIQSAQFQCFNTRKTDGSGAFNEEHDPEGSILPGYEPDIEAAATFPALVVPAGKSVSLNYGLYAGPKDYNRLDSLGDGQGALMNYDGFLPFSMLIVPMLAILHFWYLIFNNYGVAIILLTLMIKAITWPLQSIANRSGKRMQALAPKLKEIQAKYKESPEKLQTETFALYKKYGVNPFGGCLPAFIQMPVFFSLYFMLQNAVELRGQSFLWVHDLTQPDTVASWALPFVIPFLNTSHLAIHPLPIMVTGLTMVMMRMTPQIGDPTQAKVAQIMPIFFLFIFYNFAAALSLYYVINNSVSIIQIYRNLHKPMPELKEVPRKKGPGGAGAKSG